MEIELKYALENAQQYRDLITYLERYSGEKAFFLSQNNTFFDTQNRLLKKASLILRLRSENERFILTAKGAAPADTLGHQALACRLEEEVEISAQKAQSLLAGEEDPIKLLQESEWPQNPQAEKSRLLLIGHLQTARAQKPLIILGAFKNERRVIPISLNGTVFHFECDATHFSPARIDYEVEVELPSAENAAPVEDFVSKCFAELEIPKKTAPGKAWRFFNLHQGTP